MPLQSRYRYIKSDDRETQISRPAGECKALYKKVLAQSALAVMAEELPGRSRAARQHRHHERFRQLR